MTVRQERLVPVRLQTLGMDHRGVFVDIPSILVELSRDQNPRGFLTSQTQNSHIISDIKQTRYKTAPKNEEIINQICKQAKGPCTLASCASLDARLWNGHVGPCTRTPQLDKSTFGKMPVTNELKEMWEKHGDQNEHRCTCS